MNMQAKTILRIGSICLWLAYTLPTGWAADWPMWRYDAGRTASSPEKLPAKLHLQWTKQLLPLEPAWPDQPRMLFDGVYEPICVGNLLYVASSRNDSVTAYNAETGKVRWRFFTDGPIRFAPAAWKGRLYLGSDDGCVYCLDGKDGQLLWRFNGAPRERKVLGNGRIISNWPSRGGPVVEEGRVYVSVGIWPFMGVFVVCLDADTGEVIWLNDSTGSMYILQPHDSPAFAGVAPQGYCVLDSGRLLVPGGRSVPACFDAKKGTFSYYHLAQNKKWGDSHVSSRGGFFANDGRFFDILTGGELLSLPQKPVLSKEAVYGLVGRELKAFASSPRPTKKGDKIQLELPELWSLEVPLAGTLIRAGSRLYLAGKDEILAVDLPEKDASPTISWRADMEGIPCSILAANGRLFLSTKKGQIYCFSSEKRDPTATHEERSMTSVRDAWTTEASEILKQSGHSAGIAQIWGLTAGRLAEELIRQSDLHLVAVDEDKENIAAFRKKMNDLGLYGQDVAAHVGSPSEYPFPPYLASLIVSEDPDALNLGKDPDLLKRIFHCLRPFGGAACLKLSEQAHQSIARAVTAKELPNAALQRQGDLTVLVRAGGIPGSANWTHQYGNVANTCVSKDSVVRAPLGILWFGGPAHHKILPRHGHGPSEQVADGKLIIEGPDILRAVDVYTGRILWEKDLPDIGLFYDNTSHQPGANALGSNYVSLPDAIYVAYKKEILKLDPNTGETLATFTLSPPPGVQENPLVGYLGIYEDLLLAGAQPIIFDDKKMQGRKDSWNGVASERLVVMDRHEGKELWSYQAKQALRHNAICAGNGKIFLVDKLPPGVIDEMERRGQEAPMGAELIAFDAHRARKDLSTWRELFRGGLRRTGTVIWTQRTDVFGTWLSYSQEHDVLLQAGRPSRDMLGDEPGDRIIAYQGSDGKVLWDERMGYQGPCMIHGKKIITQGEMYDLLTGERKDKIDPLTGKKEPWSFSRNYGCNTAIASQNLITFRSAAAGFFDLENSGGTGNLGGFRSGCTSNLIAANGVLNAPDYTRTCICSYQIQTSLALIPMEEVYPWTFFRKTAVQGRVERLGINLGAPGDRLAPDGTLWLEFPMVGGPSPELPVRALPEPPTTFTHEPIRYEGISPRWVAASGCEPIQKLTVDLCPKTDHAKEVSYTVKLYFAEPKELEAGDRSFSVKIQGKNALRDLDVIALAGGPKKLLVREIPNVRVEKLLEVELFPSPDSKKGPLLCGVEAVLEK